MKELIMALQDLLRQGFQYQLNILRSVGKSMISMPAGNPMGQVISLLSALGAVSRKKVINQQNESFRPIAVPISQEAPPIEIIKGIGKKFGAKMRAFGIANTEDLRVFNVQDAKLVGISQKLIEKWQNSLGS